MRNIEPGLKLIREFEGCKLHSYQDVTGVWSIGFGSTEHVGPGQVISFDQAEMLLQVDAEKRAALIEKMITAKVNDNEFSAILSFAYNVGLGALYHSHLLGKLNDGASRAVVAEELMHWTRAGGHVLGGLVRRRAAEKTLFLTPA